MALVMLKDVEVSRVNQKGYGVQVVEKSHAQGKDFTTRWTVWFSQPHGLSVGDVVSLSGFHGDKVGEPWTDKDGNQRVSVERSINNPRLDESSVSQTAPAAPANVFVDDGAPF